MGKFSSVTSKKHLSTYLSPSLLQKTFEHVCKPLAKGSLSSVSAVEPRSHPTQLITNAPEITHGHKYLREWGLSEELCLYEESWPNYAILRKMLPDSLSPPESCYQHGAEWLLLPRWQKPSACPLAAGRISEGSDASPGNASPEEPWEERSTSMAGNRLQRSKSFFKTSLTLFTNSRLRFSVAVCSTQA